MTYPDHFEVRKVQINGDISWNARGLFIGEALAGEDVGLEEVGEATWIVRFGPIELGRLKTDLPQLGLLRPRRHKKRGSHRR